MLAPNKILFEILGGADIDFDKVNVTTDKMYVKYLFENGLREHFDIVTKPTGQVKVDDNKYNKILDKLGKSKKIKTTLVGDKKYNALSDDFYYEMYKKTVVHFIVKIIW